MPNIIALRRKTNGEHIEGQKLIALDEEICRHVGVEPHPVQWYERWVDTIGFSLATSEGFANARKYWGTDPKDKAIVDYLEANFDNVSYYTAR